MTEPSGPGQRSQSAADQPVPPPRVTDQQVLDDNAALERVQRRVGAIAFFAFTFPCLLGLIFTSRHFDTVGRHSDATGLLVMSGVIGVLQFAAVRAILKASLRSPLWFTASLLPMVAAIVAR